MSNQIASGMGVDGNSIVIAPGNIIQRGTWSLMRATCSVNDQPIVANTQTLIKFNTTQLDLLGELDSSTYLFVAKSAGYYRVTFSVCGATPTSGNRSGGMIVSGAFYYSDFVEAAYGFTSVGGSDMFYLNAGGTLGIWYQNSIADTINFDPGLTKFIVERVA